MRVAVVGSGIAGLAAAHTLLCGRNTRVARDLDTHVGRELDAHVGRDVDAHVTMFETAARPGGHVYTVDAHGHAIDMGFIVCNRERYPHFCGLLDELGVETRPTTMSFSVVTQKDRADRWFSPRWRSEPHEWGSASLDAMFAQRRRVLDPRHYKFLVDVVAFLRAARRDLDQVPRRDRAMRFDLARGSGVIERAHLLEHASVDEYLAARRVSREVRDRFVVPLAAALWSLAPDLCGAFPALTYFRFLEQHGMLSPWKALPWHTVVGGSTRYLGALLAKLRATGRFALELTTPVTAIVRDANDVSVRTRDGEQHFDRVVIATHANTALSLLAQPTDDERRKLGAFRYSTNRTVLHTDRAFLPKREAAHAAWNYVADPDTARVAVTYSMTKLQGLPDAPYLVTLNPRSEPRGVLHEVEFAHPQFDRAALAAQHALPLLNGTQRTYYAGAHFGFGFHEDGMRSGVEAARALVADHRRALNDSATSESRVVTR